jgi:hypothetical protein
MISLLVCCVLAFTVGDHFRQSGATEPALDVAAPEDEEPRPHDANAKHPFAVTRIMGLLPHIPADASYHQIIALLGLPPDWDGGSVSSTHCSLVWRELAPGYHFVLNFDPMLKDGKLILVFTEASFSAHKKPGFPPNEYHTVFPYRSWKGMVSE